MKRIISIIVFIIGVITMQAQQFEWAKNIFGGIGEENKIDFSATDSEGNIYILGTCGTGAEIDNNTLVEVGGSQRNLILIKLNTEGILLWKKTIGANNGQDPAVNCMRLIGDSVIVVMARISLATYSNYLYYLDTLINRTQVGYPVDSLPTYPFVNNCGGGDCNGTVFFKFNLNGGLIEQHFLQTRYIDSVGSEVPVTDYFNYPITESFCNGDIQPFNIDNNGNIYILKSAIWGSMGDSNIKRYRILIDEERQFDVERRLDYSPVLLKFTPHFNDLLWAKYMIKDTVGRGDNPSEIIPYVTGMAVDNGGNIYVSGYIEQTPPSGDTTYYRDIILDSNNINNSLRVDVGTVTKDFLIKYNTEGNVDWVYSLREHSDSLLSLSFFTTQMIDVKVIDDSNMVFVSTYAGQGYASQTISQLRGSFILDDSINIEHFKGGMFIKLDKTTGRYLSHGLVESNSYSCPNELAIKNNQVFTQVQYSGILNMGDTNVEIGFNEYGLAMIRWDNRGHLIGGIDYNAVHPENRPGPTVIDNNGDLYLCGFLAGNGTFGDITVTSGAYIAKLTDSTFNVPYVYVPDTLLLNEEVKVGKMKVYPNPTESEVSIDMGNEKIKECYIMPILGEKKKISPYNKGNGRYTIDLSTYPNYTYIITVYTIKNHYQVKVVKVR